MGKILIKRRNLFKIFIITIFLLENNFLYLIPLPDIFLSLNDLHHKFLILVIIIFYILFDLKNILNDKYIFGNFIFLWIIMYLYTFIVSYMKYGEKLVSYFSVSNHFLIILGYFIIKSNLKSDEDIEFIEKVMMYISIIVTIIFFIQVICFDSKGIFLNSILNDRFRFGEIRIHNSAQFIRIASIIGLANFFKQKNRKGLKILGIVSCLCGLFYELNIEKSRGAILVLVITYIVMILYFYRNRIGKILLSVVVTIIIATTFIISPLGKEYIDISSDKTSKSFTARKEAREYFMDQFKDNPIFGMGFIPFKSTTDENYYILRGPKGMYYRDDVGIFGYIHTFGTLGIVVYWLLFYRLFKFNINNLIYKILDKYLESIGIFIYLIVSSYTLIFTDPQYIIALPIGMAISEFIYLQGFNNIKIIKAKDYMKRR